MRRTCDMQKVQNGLHFSYENRCGDTKFMQSLTDSVMLNAKAKLDDGKCY